MKVIYNSLIPFKGYAAINIFGILLVRKGVNVTPRMINHEKIHTAQMRELLFVFFYLWYLVEWIVRLPMKGNAYRNICFEREAYEKEKDPDYLSNRDPWSFIGYLR
nr:MAG TPA: hypothetical protein [Caudoviricetes sp.]